MFSVFFQVIFLNVGAASAAITRAGRFQFAAKAAPTLFRQTVLIALILLTVLASGLATRPNILFCISDDQSWAHMVQMVIR